MRACLLFRLRSLFLACLVLIVLALPLTPAMAITPPELRVQQTMQDISADMHGLDLKQREFLRTDLRAVNLSDADLRGAVINSSQLQDVNLQGADLEDVVAFASRFDRADLRGANFTNGMLMQSFFNDALIEGADFSDAVIDLPQQRALCARAEGVNPVSGISTLESLGCRS
ncbi:MAG: pentapeptide repeat-containing protein [Prochlorococcus sp.]|nr:pentapeptide repeat-containing protein [Prochlorococcaceae cyanobacterium Fu_MAG_50]